MCCCSQEPSYIKGEGTPGLRNDREGWLAKKRAILAFTKRQHRLQKEHIWENVPQPFHLRGENGNPRGGGTCSVPPTKLMVELRSFDPSYLSWKEYQPGCLTPGFKSCLYCLVCVLAVSNPAGWREMLLLCLPPRLAVRVIDAEIFCQELCQYRVMLHLFA